MLFLIFLSVEALFRTSVLNRHNRVYVADPMLSEIRSTPVVNRRSKLRWMRLLRAFVVHQP